MEGTRPGKDLTTRRPLGFVAQVLLNILTELRRKEKEISLNNFENVFQYRIVLNRKQINIYSSNYNKT